MSSTENPNGNKIIPKITRAGLNIIGGAIPFAGGILSATAAEWSEQEQEKVTEFLKYRQQLFEKDLAEQFRTIHEILRRLEKIDVDVSERLESSEFQGLVEKCFKNWSDINSEEKREYIRNLLVNAASVTISSDSVIRLFIEWISQYSELHFQVIACVYRHQNGITRGAIWSSIGRESVREDSADADLYKLLIRDLSTGGIIRQFRQTDYEGNYIKNNVPKQRNKFSSKNNKSAFDESDNYVLTELGKQFVHYAMSDVSTKIGHQKQH